MKQPVGYQRVEAGIAFVAILYFYLHLDYKIVWFILLLFTIDVFMLGYVSKNNRIGAHLYNIGHSLGIPLIVLILGVAASNDWLIGGSLIWLAHIAWDRALGYGLKYQTGFKDTHLGQIGKK